MKADAMWLVRRFTIAQVSLPNTNKNSDIFTGEPIFTSCLYHAGHKLTLPFRIHLMRFIWRALHLEFLYALFVVLFGFTFESMSSWLSGCVLVFFFTFLVRMLHFIFTYFITAAHAWCCWWSCFIGVMCSCVDRLFTLEMVYRNCCYC